MVTDTKFPLSWVLFIVSDLNDLGLIDADQSVVALGLDYFDICSNTFETSGC